MCPACVSAALDNPRGRKVMHAALSDPRRNVHELR